MRLLRTEAKVVHDVVTVLAAGVGAVRANERREHSSRHQQQACFTAAGVMSATVTTCDDVNTSVTACGLRNKKEVTTGIYRQILQGALP